MFFDGIGFDELSHRSTFILCVPENRDVSLIHLIFVCVLCLTVIGVVPFAELSLESPLKL